MKRNFTLIWQVNDGVFRFVPVFSFVDKTSRLSRLAEDRPTSVFCSD
jgi:hypothetical protein